jgi:uncharacterized protein YkwD
MDVWSEPRGRRAAARPAHYSRAAARFLVAFACVFTSASTPAQGTPSFTRQVEARVLELVNDFRSEHDLEALQSEARLERTADYFSGYMARTGELDHRADGKTPAARVQQRGYRYCVVSENIAYEYSSRGFSADALARNFFNGWRESSTHRANILDPAVTQTGVGVARNSKGEYFAAQVFARPVAEKARKGKGCR